MHRNIGNNNQPRGFRGFTPAPDKGMQRFLSDSEASPVNTGSSSSDTTQRSAGDQTVERESISVNGFIVRRLNQSRNSQPSGRPCSPETSLSTTSSSVSTEYVRTFERQQSSVVDRYVNPRHISSDTDNGSISDDTVSNSSNLETEQSYSSVPSRSSSIASLSGYSKSSESTAPRGQAYQASSRGPMKVMQDQMSRMALDTTIVAPKKAPAERVGKRQVSLLTNVFPMEVQPKEIYRYDTSMKLVTANGSRTVDLHFKGNNSADVSSRQKLCMFLLRRALEQYRIMREGEFVVHDGSAAVYCTESLDAALKPHGYSLEIAFEDLPPEIRSLVHVPNAGKVVIDVKTCSDGAVLNTAQYYSAQSNHNMGKLDRTFKQFFDLLTSYDAIKDGRFHVVRAGKMFDKNYMKTDLGCGHERAHGLDKGIKFIEGSRDSRHKGVYPALVLDAKMGDFFKDQCLKKSIEQLLKHLHLPCYPFPFDRKDVRSEGTYKNVMNPSWTQVNNFVKGLRMKRLDKDGLKCSFVAAGITDVPVCQVMEDGFTPDSAKYPMMGRFVEHSRMIDPNLPAVVFRGFDHETRAKKIVHFPMELLEVAEGQSVPMDKMLCDPNRAEKPHERFAKIERNLKALNLHDGGVHNQLLAAFGVRIASKPLSVAGIERQKPKIGYNNRGQISYISADDIKGNWRMPMPAAYPIPAIISQLFIIGEENVTDSVKQQLIMHCPKRGIAASNIIELAFNQRELETYDKLDELFQRIANENLPNQFVIFIDSKEKKTHHELKLLERKHQVRTMHITRQLALRMRDQGATRDNIIAKLNEKAGGVNHFVQPDQYGKWFDSSTMFIGYDVQHPGAAGRDEIMNKKPPMKPSVVGFSFNGGRDTSAFIGDFHYQNPRQEKVDGQILNVRMKWMLKLFRESRGQLPSAIFVIRDGVSEGQYNMVMNDEFSSLREGLEEYKNLNPDTQEWSPKFVLIIVTKRHNVRLVSEVRGAVHNPNPGTVVDDKIVRNDMTEFYLQAHRVLIGTGKFPSYQVLIDELNTTNDELQSVMHALAYCHKIVDSPVSLPEPVYMADEWAKRGGNLFTAFGDRHKFPRVKTYDKEQYCEAPINFDLLSKYLAYWNTKLEAFRVNA